MTLHNNGSAIELELVDPCADSEYVFRLSLGIPAFEKFAYFSLFKLSI